MASRCRVEPREVRVGETLGVPSQGRLTLAALRILALVTDAFGGRGGIAQYNRDFLASLVRCDSVSEVIVLPRFAGESTESLPASLHQLRPIKGKLLYSLYAMKLALTYKIDLVFCGHVFMVPLAMAVSKT